MKVRLRIRFEPRDLWVGVYWNTSLRVPLEGGMPQPYLNSCLDIYVCIVPVFPLHLRLVWRSL